MKYLLTISATILLIVSASASAWRDNDNRNNWRHYNNYDGRYDGSGDTSGDGSLRGNVEFNIKMHGDADTYVYGNMRNGSENIYFDRYYNNSNGSGYGGYYRNARQPFDGRPPNYAPYQRPVYGERYVAPQR